MTATAPRETRPPAPHPFAPLEERRPLPVAAAVGLGAVALLATAALLPRVSKRRPPAPARRLRRGAAVLSASVLADSAVEHYRGGFHHRAMFAAPAAGAAALAALAPPPGRATGLRKTLMTAAIGAGAIGHLYHLRNVLRRPGAPSWEAVFYAAPLGAPGALVLAGAGGLAALRLDQTPPEGDRARRKGRTIAVGASAGLLGTSAEATLLHFRGAFHSPAMWLPVTLPPVAALALAEAGRRASPAALKRSRLLLRAVVGMGLLGTAFHARGVARNMGGWRNWSQNLQVAPPLPAPPSFAGVALGGLAALDLMEKGDRA